MAERAPDRRRDKEYMAELSRRGVAARARKRAARERGEVPVDPTADLDPWEVLRSIAGDTRTPAYSRTQAAKALMAQPSPEAEQEWRSSVQVRPDFLPPSWGEVLLVARAAGAI